MRQLFISLLFLSSDLIYGQIDYNLSRQIDSLAAIDQKWRGLFRQVNNKEIDSVSLDFVDRQVYITDSLNFIQIKNLFDKYGYLGYDKVGMESSHSFWLLVQHADRHPSFQDSVLSKMRIEAEKSNSSLIDYAYLIDRVKINSGQPQIYGTQMTLNPMRTSYEPKSVIEPDKLNDRRKQVGLNTIEDYIRTMNERYYGDLRKK